MENKESQPSTIGKITDTALDKLGFTSESIQKIKFGRGVVGKLSVLSAIAIVGVIAIGLKFGSPSTLLMLLEFLAGLLALSIGAIVFVVCKHPEISVLEGAELIRYKQLSLGVKGQPQLPTQSPPVPDPQGDAVPNDPQLNDGDDS